MCSNLGGPPPAAPTYTLAAALPLFLRVYVCVPVSERGGGGADNSSLPLRAAVPRALKPRRVCVARRRRLSSVFFFVSSNAHSSVLCVCLSLSVCECQPRRFLFQRIEDRSALGGARKGERYGRQVLLLSISCVRVSSRCGIYREKESFCKVAGC